MNSEIEQIRRKIKNKKIQVPVIKKEKSKHYLTKLLCIVIITLVCLIGIKKNETFKEKFHSIVYDNNFPFATVSNLYKKYFGSILPLEDVFNTHIEPVFSEKFTFLSKEDYLDGTKFTVQNNYLIPIIESGMVVYIGEKEGYGNTIIIQQVDGVDIWYSNINSNVKLYDYIEKGDVLGEVNGNHMYLVIKKGSNNLKYEDYTKV